MTRMQIGHSKHLTMEPHADGSVTYRSYETPILVTDKENKIVFADTRVYSAMTTRHQRQLQHVHPGYRLPTKREKVEYEYRLVRAGENGWGVLYSPQYKAKGNEYDPWHEEWPGQAWDWSTAYNQLYDIVTTKTGVYSEQAVHDNFVGTF